MYAQNAAKIPDKRLKVLPGLWLRLPNSVTSPIFLNFYIGLKSTNALNINVFLLPTKLLPLLNYLCTAWSLISPSCSCYSLCCHPLSTTYTFFSKNHQSLISLCITSSLESTSYLIPPASYKTPSWWCHIYKFTSHLLTTLILHHTFTVSFIPIQAQNSPFPQIVSTAYSLLAPTSAFSDYTGPDLLGSTVFFHFCLLFIFFILVVR